jgi:hypothetical protein
MLTTSCPQCFEPLKAADELIIAAGLSFTVEPVGVHAEMACQE